MGEAAAYFACDRKTSESERRRGEPGDFFHRVRETRSEAAIAAQGVESQAQVRQRLNAAGGLPESPDELPHVGKKGRLCRESGRTESESERRRGEPGDFFHRVRETRSEAAIAEQGVESQTQVRQRLNAAGGLPESPDELPHVGKKGRLCRESREQKEEKQAVTAPQGWTLDSRSVLKMFS